MLVKKLGFLTEGESLSAEAIHDYISMFSGPLTAAAVAATAALCGLDKIAQLEIEEEVLQANALDAGGD